MRQQAMATLLSSTSSFAGLFCPHSSSVCVPGRNAGPRRTIGERRTRVVSSWQSSPSFSSTCDEPHGEKWLASRRTILNTFFSAISAGLFAFPALALLEADDDESLLEKVKEDRKKRIEKKNAISSLKDEAESLQKAVLELSKAGQAIDGDDFGLATSVLGTDDVAWIKKVKASISKVNKNAEEAGEAEHFTSALQKLQSAVIKKDSKQSKTAFVASASALEKWSLLTGLSVQLKGL